MFWLQNYSHRARQVQHLIEEQKPLLTVTLDDESNDAVNKFRQSVL